MSRKKKRNKKEPQPTSAGNLSKDSKNRGAFGSPPHPLPSPPKRGRGWLLGRVTGWQPSTRNSPELSNPYLVPAPAARRLRAGILLVVTLLICMAVAFLLFQ